MLLSMIAAVAENGVIGSDGGMPWHLPADLKFFRKTTMGKPIIMGRKTLESIGKPLDGRLNIVLTRQPNVQIEGCTVVSTLDHALASARAGGADEAIIIGGGQLYSRAMPLAQRLFLTRIHETFEGDTYFPEIDLAAWIEVKRENHVADAKNSHDYSFCVLERIEINSIPLSD